MDVEFFRDICLELPHSSEEFPFDEVTLVFKVKGKMFAAIGLDKPDSVNLKCDPEKAIEYRASYLAVQPGYHMNKMHWNTVFFNEDVSDELIRAMVKDSYDLVVAKLPLRIRKEM